MSKPIVLVGASIAASVGAYLLWSSSKGSGGDNILPKDIILEIFTSLTSEMPKKLAPLFQEIQQAKAQGKQIDETQLQQIILQSFEQALKASQAELFAQYGVDESEVEQSTSHYMQKKDEEVLGVVNNLRQLYAQLGGEVGVEVPDWLTEEKMCAALEDYIKAKSTMLTMMEMQKSQGGRMTEQQSQMLSEHVNMQVTAALAKHGLSIFEWTAAEKAFNASSAKFKKRHDEDSADMNAKLTAIVGGQ